MGKFILLLIVKDGEEKMLSFAGSYIDAIPALKARFGLTFVKHEKGDAIYRDAEGKEVTVVNNKRRYNKAFNAFYGEK